MSSALMLLFYNILFPLAFLAFVPGLLYKLWKRDGHKKSYWERFALFSEEKIKVLRDREGCVWIHAVSVGETMIALALLSEWQKSSPERRFVLSTTTTTAQALAISKAPKNVPVFFCPLDFLPFVSKTISLIRPSMLVIFETEIWPSLILETCHNEAKVALVNARMSDHSVKGYRRMSFFFGPLLSKLSLVAAQSEEDAKRFSSICEGLSPEVSGNMKFDQKLPANMAPIELDACFGKTPRIVLLGASTHPGEERLLTSTFKSLKTRHPELKLILVPRHAERGAEIATELELQNLSFLRRSNGSPSAGPVDCLLADTTGELLSFIAAADIVVMGKSLAGHDEGHNLIEPALLSKPIVTGAVLKNFRFVLEVLRQKEALVTVSSDAELEESLEKLIATPSRRLELGAKACAAIEEHKGAIIKTIKLLEGLP
ncbi:MAG: hypothetical protein A2X49_07480 [Lentisphaerae bacterium GWF2_52_8]|nr:MAG: hypothetical protein A2X49_07480 [Lentisphaerae bacterium GWF2_52_8]